MKKKRTIIAGSSDSLDESVSVVLELEVLEIPLLRRKDRDEDDRLLDGASDEVEVVEFGGVVAQSEVDDGVGVVSSSLRDGVEGRVDVAEESTKWSLRRDGKKQAKMSGKKDERSVSSA
jgi:hypothetical protein